MDSGGGDALASDLMWREIQLLSKEKPVVASMSDVAASGGYYMSMASRGGARARAKREVRGVVASMCKHGCQRRLLHEHGKSGRVVCVRARVWWGWGPECNGRGKAALIHYGLWAAGRWIGERWRMRKTTRKCASAFPRRINYGLRP